MKITRISQTDPRWKNIKVGSGSKTFGQIGCLVCCNAMILGLDNPTKLNDKSNFADGNLWIWNSISKYGGQYVRKINYSSNKLLEIVQKYGATIIAVKNYGHYVVYTKNNKTYDPNGGRILDGLGGYTPCAIYEQVPNQDGYVDTLEIYSLGRYKVTDVAKGHVLKVREKNGINERCKTYEELTPNARKQNTDLGNPYANGYLNGVEFDVKLIYSSDGYVWGQSASGWVALDYCTKV